MDNPLITIRKAVIDDAPRIAELSAEIFVQSYEYPYDQKDMDTYLKEHFNVKRISKELQDKDVFYYVAEADHIVGFSKSNANMWTPRFKGRLTFELKRLYVQKDMESQNIGTYLITTALETAKKRGFRIIWFSVWENNERSIEFHRKFGFEVVGDGTFTLGKTNRKYLVMQYK